MADLILKLRGATLTGGRRLKEGGTYFKVRAIFLMKFQNFAIFSFKLAINNYHYVIQCYIFQNY